MITKEQKEELKSLITDAELDILLLRLNNSYGDGEVLNFSQLKHFIETGMNQLLDKDMLTLYIDTIRILRLMDKDANQVLELNISSTIALHDKLSSEYKTEINEIKKSEYQKSVAPFIKLSGDFEKIKVELIATLEELNTEGSSMNHCIATYHDIIINKHYIGFRIFNKITEERLTLGCYRKDNQLYFNQLKGWGNAPAKKESCLAVIEFCESNKIPIPQQDIHDLMPAFYN